MKYDKNDMVRTQVKSFAWGVILGVIAMSIPLIIVLSNLDKICQ